MGARVDGWLLVFGVACLSHSCCWRVTRLHKKTHTPGEKRVLSNRDLTHFPRNKKHLLLFVLNFARLLVYRRLLINK